MKYGFIGCGNMGGAIARAMGRGRQDIAVTDRSGRAMALAEELGIAYWSAEEIAAECETVFLAVKPHMMRDAIAPVRETLARRKPLLVTMAAGLELRQDRKSTRLNSSHSRASRMPSSA